MSKHPPAVYLTGKPLLRDGDGLPVRTPDATQPSREPAGSHEAAPARGHNLVGKTPIHEPEQPAVQPPKAARRATKNATSKRAGKDS